jgi:hypothetical protein
LEASSGGQYTVDYLTFMATTIPLCILFIVAYFLVMKYVFKPDVSKLRNLSEAYLESMRSDLKLNPAQKIAGAFPVIYGEGENIYMDLEKIAEVFCDDSQRLKA